MRAIQLGKIRTGKIRICKICKICKVVYDNRSQGNLMKLLRSLLFVPGDSEKKLAKACAGTADALILDLEDAVTAERRPLARSIVLNYLRGRGLLR